MCIFSMLLFVRREIASFADTRALIITDYNLGGFYMIQRLHRLKNKRGYTMLELMIVIAIIAIMAGTIIAGTTNRQNRVREANATAKDFFTTIQTEFTRFQMFDGPLTMSLQKQYDDANLSNIVNSKQYGGLMWYPLLGGNYPIVPDADKMAAVGFTGTFNDWRNQAKPPIAGISIEVEVKNNKIMHVDWQYSTSALFAQTTPDEDVDGKTRSELSAVLQLELDKRMEYRDGFYYARIIYVSPAGIPSPSGAATVGECRSNPVQVLWAAYCRNEITSDENTYKFRNNNVTQAGEVVGLVGGKLAGGVDLGTPGTSVLDVVDVTTMV